MAVEINDVTDKTIRKKNNKKPKKNQKKNKKKPQQSLWYETSLQLK